MNGWAKIAGALSIVAGIVFILGIALAISDGCDFGEYPFECFACNSFFSHSAALAGLIAAVAGIVAICGGARNSLASASVCGVTLIGAGLILAIAPFKGDVSSISWHNMEIILAGALIFACAGIVILAAKTEKFVIAIIAILLAFVIDIVYLLDTFEGMLVPVFGALVFVLAGVSLIAIKGISFVEESAEAEEESIVVIKLAPASEPVAAGAYVPKPVEEAKPAEAAKPAAKAAAAKAAPAKEEAKPAEAAPAKAEEAKPAEAAKAAEEAKPAAKAEEAKPAAAAPAPAKEAAPAEESELDKLLKQGWKVTVDTVGEDKANDMNDCEIMAVISVADNELYQKLSALTGIVVSTGDDEETGAVVEEAGDDWDIEFDDSPSALFRRSCWSKGLRCRKNYGPYYIPIAFVKGKVAVYLDGDKPDVRNDDKLAAESWVVLHFKESDITTGEEQAQITYDAVKENVRALKKAKTKSKAKKKR